MATIAIIVDWSGPFIDIKQAKIASKNCRQTLYLASGKRRYQRKTSLQYVGISSDPQSRFAVRHHKLPEITSGFKIWIGTVNSHAMAGPKAANAPAKHSTVIDLAESTLAYFLELALNERKRKDPPKRSVVVISRWFQRDFVTRRHKRAHIDWPDLIEFDRNDNIARLQWFGSPGKSRRFAAAGIKRLSLTQSIK